MLFISLDNMKTILNKKKRSIDITYNPIKYLSVFLLNNNIYFYNYLKIVKINLTLSEYPLLLILRSLRQFCNLLYQ